MTFQRVPSFLSISNLDLRKFEFQIWGVYIRDFSIWNSISLGRRSSISVPRRGLCPCGSLWQTIQHYFLSVQIPENIQKSKSPTVLVPLHGILEPRAWYSNSMPKLQLRQVELSKTWLYTAQSRLQHPHFLFHPRAAVESHDLSLKFISFNFGSIKCWVATVV